MILVPEYLARENLAKPNRFHSTFDRLNKAFFGEERGTESGTVDAVNKTSIKNSKREYRTKHNVT